MKDQILMAAKLIVIFAALLDGMSRCWIEERNVDFNAFWFVRIRGLSYGF
jgi:hypothetical protein